MSKTHGGGVLKEGWVVVNGLESHKVKVNICEDLSYARNFLFQFLIFEPIH